MKIESDLPPTDDSTTQAPGAGGIPGAQDVALVRRAAAGDGKAFHALVDRHADRLYRLAISMVGNATDAEDVLQETFAGAFKGLKGFEERASVKTWLTRILMTQAALVRRDRKRRNRSPRDGEADRLVTAGEAGPVGAKIDVNAAIEMLSADHREVLLLREFEQMSYDEIADVLEVPRGTVESRLHRARAELKELLKAYLP